MSQRIERDQSLGWSPPKVAPAQPELTWWSTTGQPYAVAENPLGGKIQIGKGFKMTKTLTRQKASTSKAQFQIIEAMRACTASVLSDFQDVPLTRYELGFQMGFEELGRLLNPKGYDRRHSRSELIAGLRQPSTKTSTTGLPSVQAVREYLDHVIASNKEQPSDNRYLYGYEDAHLFLWSYVDPMGFEAARGYLPR
jgi:hypothetical protein